MISQASPTAKPRSISTSDSVIAMDIGDMRSLWDARYEAKGVLWGVEPNQFLAEIAQDLEPGTALDLGCGQGRNSFWLASRGFTVTGLDLSPVAIEQATAKPDTALVLDQRLPDMLGSDVVRALHEHGARVPFVIMIDPADGARKPGVSDSLVKGLELSDRMPAAFECLLGVCDRDRRLHAAEAGLRAERTRLAALTESVRDGIAMLDPDGRIEFRLHVPIHGRSGSHGAGVAPFGNCVDDVRQARDCGRLE